MKILSFLGKKYTKRLDEFSNKFKKPYDKRTVAEKIMCENYFYINFSGKNDMRRYGALESILIIKGYIKAGEEGFYKKDGYKETITKLTEKYLTDRDIL